MNVKKQKAIRNNNGLYEEIFGSRNIKSIRTDLIWYCLENTPPLYSNLVTISEKWQPDEIFSEIDRKFKIEKWDEWSIKDSFGLLDLNKYGFAKLFNAEWIYLEAEKFTPKSESRNLRYEIVRSEDALAQWRCAWDSDEKTGIQIFSAELLHNPRVFFVAGYDYQQIISGCFVNRTGNVLGISNFFSPEKDSVYWSEIISFIFDTKGRLDIACYERTDLVKDLQSLGFESVGDLIVWLKRKKY